MPIQKTVTGDKKLVGNKSIIKYRNDVKREEFHSDILDVYTDEETLSPVVKIENTYGKETAHYRDVEPIETTEEYFIYPITQETLDRLGDVEELKQESE